MNNTPKSESLSKALREWDPRGRHGVPDPARTRLERARLLAAARNHEQARSPRQRRKILPTGVRWAVATALVVVAIAVALTTRTSFEKPEAKIASDRPTESVQWQMTASNGVRVFWNLTLTDSIGEER